MLGVGLWGIQSLLESLREEGRGRLENKIDPMFGWIKKGKIG